MTEAIKIVVRNRLINVPSQAEGVRILMTTIELLIEMQITHISGESGRISILNIVGNKGPFSQTKN